MKLIIVFLFAACLSVRARGVAQEITLSGKAVSLPFAFSEIKRQTGLLVFYRTDVIEKLPAVAIRADKMPLKQFLSELLKNVSLTYTIKQNTITISEKKTAAPKQQEILEVLAAAPPFMEVHGIVTDSAGVALAGAFVRIRSSGKTVSTETSGEFHVQGVKEADVLEISYVGYAPKAVPVKAGYMVIRMLPVETKLDEMIIIGYGATTRRMSTGSTGRVTGDEITKQPVSNPIVALEGRVPGLFITQTAGYAGANVSVVIRGQNSLTLNTSSPLYVVDGIPFNSSPVEQSIGGFSTSSSFSPLNTINPADIESIDVLKDADATAIYGSRGANGVILITTRKSRPGATHVTAEFSQGFGKVTNKVDMLNLQEYRALRNQAFANDNIIPTATNAPDLKLWDTTRYNSFPDILLGGTSHQTNAGLSVTGGDAYTQYTLGGTYRRESTIYPGGTDDKAAQFRLNVQHKSRDNRFANDIVVNYNIDNNTIPSYTMNLLNYGLPADYPLYNTDGSLYFGPGYTNPLAAFNTSVNLKSANLNANTMLRYTLLRGLDIKASVGYNLIDVKGTIITPASASNPANNSTPTVYLSNNYIKTYIAEPQLNYKLATGKGRLNVILGGTWQQTQTVQPYWILGTYTNIQLVNSLGAVTVLAKSSGYADYRYTSGFGRAEYIWNDKYLFSGNIRRDGSSRFGDSNRFGTFGSVAGAWIFSKEKWLAQSAPWLSYGKLRASYGTVGNDKIGDYYYEPTYSSSSAYGPYVTLLPSRIANPNLKWEQTKKLDIAMELGFLKDRILFTATYYRNRSSNLLGYVPLAGQTGFDSYTGNFDGTVQNKGGEFELRTTNIRNKEFSWTSSVNLTVPQNKLISYPGLLNSTYNNSYVVGYSLNLRNVYHFTGFKDGVATVQDKNNDGAITSGISANGKGDYIIYGTNDPVLYGGFNNTFTWKGFQLDLFFQGIKRTSVRGDAGFASYPGSAYNIPKTLLDIGFKPSTSTTSAAATSFSRYINSDAAVEDASFIRLKNVSLAYNVPAGFCKKMRMSAVQLYVHGQNLLTITGYKGLDPETLSNAMPTLKMYVAGIRTTF